MMHGTDQKIVVVILQQHILTLTGKHQAKCLAKHLESYSIALRN